MRYGDNQWKRPSPVRASYRRSEKPYSPVRGISQIEDPRGKPTEVPEYHPTPKKVEDESYKEYKRDVEQAKKTGAIRRYVIPKRGRDSRDSTPTETSYSGETSKVKKVEETNVTDIQSTVENVENVEKPSRRYDWKKDSERK